MWKRVASPLSIIGAIAAFWGAAVKGLEWAENADFVREHIPLANRFCHYVIELIGHPPGWALLAIPLAGVGLVFLDQRRISSSKNGSIAAPPTLSITTDGWMSWAVPHVERGIGYFVKITNNSDGDIDNCQIELAARSLSQVGEDCYYVSSSPFSLRPKEEQILPIIYTDAANPNSAAYIVHYAPEDSDWKRSKAQVVLTDPSYELRVRVLASGNAPSTLNLKLRHDGKWGVTKC